MEPRINIITLAVSDLERSLSFYREGLGLPSVGVTGSEFSGDDVNAAAAIAMFHLDGGLILALYPRAELAKDAGVAYSESRSSEFSLGYFVANRDEVDSVLTQAEAAGGRLSEPPRDRPWGIYSGYFRDLDGHLWEIIWNPRSEPETSG